MKSVEEVIEDLAKELHDTKKELAKTKEVNKATLDSVTNMRDTFFKERNEYRARVEAAALFIDAGLYHDAYRALGKH